MRGDRVVIRDSRLRERERLTTLTVVPNRLTTEYERRKDTLDSLEMRIATIVKRLSVRTKDERKSDEDGALETRGTRAESSGSFPSPDPESILQLQREMLEGMKVFNRV